MVNEIDFDMSKSNVHVHNSAHDLDHHKEMVDKYLNTYENSEFYLPRFGSSGTDTNKLLQFNVIPKESSYSRSSAPNRFRSYRI